MFLWQEQSWKADKHEDLICQLICWILHIQILLFRRQYSNYMNNIISPSGIFKNIVFLYYNMMQYAWEKVRSYSMGSIWL